MSIEPAVYGSDVVIAMLQEMDIEFAAFNPGASFRGLHDSVLNYGRDPRIEVIQCCHEEISVAVAHGYAKAAGKPMAVMLHDVVGLQHASMAIFNAWCDRVPILLLGGTGPMDTTARRPTIDWIHTALVQGNQVRDYVKWDDQPYSVESVPASLLRAYRIALTAPQGPVYICFDVDIQEGKKPEAMELPKLDAFALPTPPAPELDALQFVARALCDARLPIAVSDYVGRSTAGVDSLRALAEMLSMPVLDAGMWSKSVIFPNTHPLDLTGGEGEIYGKADVVLAIEVDDLHGTLRNLAKGSEDGGARTSPNPSIFHISVKELQTNKWIATHQELQPMQVSLTADPDVALQQLVTVCRELLDERPVDQSRVARASEFAKMHTSIRETWHQEALLYSKEEPIAVPWLALQIWEEIKNTDWVIANGTLKGWTRKLWEWENTDCFYGMSAGAGLGYGIGASLGVALAYKDTGKVCVDLQDDGDFLFAPSALWTAEHYRLPLLIVMNNNRTYYNSEVHQERVASTRDRDVGKASRGTRIDDPCVDYAMLAKSFGMYAEGPITDPSTIRPSIRRALEVVEGEKRPALVDVVTAPYAY